MSRGVPAVLLAVALLAGCSSTTAVGSPAKTAIEASRGAAGPEAPPPVEVRSLELRQGEDGAHLDIVASSPVAWTSYRDSASNLVIELPNAVADPALGPIEAKEGPVRWVELRSNEGAGRPMTRIVVVGRGPAEHSVTADGSSLRVDLLPLPAAPTVAESSPGAAQPATVAEPVAAAARQPETEELEVAAAPPPSEPARVGTPDDPLPGPPVNGVVATQFQGVRVEGGGSGRTTIAVRGDGEFVYSTFRLSDPERFVLDLVGVVNSSPRGQVPVGDGQVERVRMAQFKPQPEPVARVVFDLAAAVVPAIEPTADGLVLVFDSAPPSRGAWSAPPVAPAEQVAAVPPHREIAAADPPAGAPPPVAETAAEPARDPASASELERAAALQVAAEAEDWSSLEEAPPAVAKAPEPVLDAAPPAADVYEPAAEADEPAAAEEAAAHSNPTPAVPPARRESVAVPGAAPPATSDVALFEAAQVQLEEPTPSVEQVVKGFESRPVGAGERVYRGAPMTLTLKDGDIKDVLRSFAQISGLNMVIQPGVSGTVTVELVQVPWDQALEQILRINNLGYQLEGNIMRIAPIGKLREEAEENQRLKAAQALAIPLRTVMKRVSYADANELAGVLRSSVLSQRGSVIVDRRTNTLILKELPEYMDTVVALVENLDTPEPQVMIEARIVETTKRFTRTLGVDWSFNAISDAAHGNTTGLQFPNNGSAAGGVQLLTGASNGFLNVSLGNVLNTFTLDATLQAAESEGLINILSAPKVATLNNEEAEIQSGLQIPIQTIANNTVSVQFINATLRLAVTPHVTAEGTVLMDISIQKREPQLAFAVVGATNAPIATKEARTRVIVRDGGTTVIGGIYEVSTDQGSDRVPGLSNVPILGHLFKNKRRTDENQELLIFITPRVIKL